MPSTVGPRLENGATASSAVVPVLPKSAAPTVSTNGSSAGLASLPGPSSPSLPAATTTRMPARHAFSTA
jgi:hypothetical protein